MFLNLGVLSHGENTRLSQICNLIELAVDVYQVWGLMSYLHCFAVDNLKVGASTCSGQNVHATQVSMLQLSGETQIADLDTERDDML